MPKRTDVKKIMVLGSGPIIIGQAAEFDYAGTQACRALKEEGIEVVLVNSNPATIMTDKNIADKVYIEPLIPEVVKRIIKIEKPDSILPTLGGQIGLNLAMELAECGFLEENNVKLLGTRVSTIKKAEDRQEFKDTMESINQPCIASKVVDTYEDALAFAKEISFPVIVRPAYTMGGTGGGIAYSEKELSEIVPNGLRASRVHQVLIEKCISGWKEIEFEVMRDSYGNCITICSMENIDPVGIHTGDSIVVAPAQTLAAKEYNMLRSAALSIISTLKIEGGCNVQFALHPESFDYAVIEVNPRVSRSSALASKATGYPIAKVATKIAVGYALDEIENKVTGKTFAFFEPAIDYIVTKLPRFPFDKFVNAEKTLGTQMKATGEVMSMGLTIEESLIKAVQSVEAKCNNLRMDKYKNLTTEELLERIKENNDERLYLIAEAFYKGVKKEEIHEITKIDMFFLDKIYNIALQKYSHEKDNRGFKKVDTCAAEYEAQTPYYYSAGSVADEGEVNSGKKILVIGSGPIRIGQGIEFDYCSVHCVWALKKKGYETIIANNNPETVSTDFDTADKLYFEPLTPEYVQKIVDREKPDGAIVQFGGQTAIKLTKALVEMGVPILGTRAEDIDAAEDRELFDAILEKCGIERPAGLTFFTEEEGIAAANQLGYPVLVRPSYVLGGQGMEIAYNDSDMKEFIEIINRVKQEHPILVDKYMMGKEIEVDAICDGEDILIPGIMEHLERAGVHSGDSISVYPARTVDLKFRDKIVDYTYRLAKALNVVGLINIQFVLYNDEIYVIEVNPRSSRTVPYISKVTNIPMVDIATRCILGEKLKDMGYGVGLHKDSQYTAVKVPVFSFEKLHDVDVSLGPEMKSTGEVLGIAESFSSALYKGLLGAGIRVPKKGNLFVSVKDSDKQEMIPIIEGFYKLGFTIYATGKTAKVLNSNFIPTNVVRKIDEEGPNILDYMQEGKFDLVINTPTRGRRHGRDGFKIRRKAVETSIPCLTSLDTAKGLLETFKAGTEVQDVPLIDITTI